MKLKEALEIGIDCGLETVDESLRNIQIHSSGLFAYAEIDKELNELVSERNNLFSKTNFTDESKAADVLTWINSEDDGIATSDLPL